MRIHRAALLAAFLSLTGMSNAAQDEFGSGPLTLPANVEVPALHDVEFVFKGSTGDPESDRVIKEVVQSRAGLRSGDRYDQVLADSATMRMRRIDGVRNVTFQLKNRINPDGVSLVFNVHLINPALKDGSPQGLFNSGELGSLPLLYQDDRSILKLTLNGGSGVFSDKNAWFGAPYTFTKNNPLVPTPALGAQTGSTTTWTENYLEYGLLGSRQMGNSPFYLYGAASMMVTNASGQDPFWDGSRTQSGVEKLYAGLLYVGTQGGSANLSVGRQNFSLNDGFLISQFGSQYNAGPRAGIYLAPRTAQDSSVLGQIQWDKWTLKGFGLNPNEYEPIESNTKVYGGNLRYTWNPSTYADASYITVPSSDSMYRLPDGTAVNRMGLQTLAAHLRWADRDVLPGLWFETEYAHQTHSNFPMDAYAGYGTLGYLASSLPWSPSLSYRYSTFSGDNPNTKTYERFDTLFSGGLGEWLQGISMGKVLSQSNRTVHRIRLNVSPINELNLTLDYYKNFANQLNNLGANPALSQLSSTNLGQELQFVGRWSVNSHLYLMGIIAYAMPGPAIIAATGNTAKPWMTFQAQLFWNW